LNLNSLNGNEKQVQQHSNVNGANENHNIQQFNQQQQQQQQQQPLPFQQFAQQVATSNQQSQQQVPPSVQLQHQQPSLSIHAQPPPSLPHAQQLQAHPQQMPPVSQQAAALTGQFYPSLPTQTGPVQKPNQPVGQAMPYQNVQNLVNIKINTKNSLKFA